MPKFFGTPLLSQERVKLRTSNFVGLFIGSIETKAHENVVWVVALGVVREYRKFSGHPCMGRIAHCAVIFAIAQLSCQYFSTGSRQGRDDRRGYIGIIYTSQNQAR